jgi:hypothetical protein
MCASYVDDSVQSSRIASTHSLLGLDFAQFLPLSQRIGLMSLKKADTEAVSMSELLLHAAGMIGQIQELFQRRHAVSTAVHKADTEAKAAVAQMDNTRRRVAMGEKVRSTSGGACGATQESCHCARTEACAHSCCFLADVVCLCVQTAEDESRASTHAAQCAAILRDRSNELATFHSIAEQQIRLYTARRRAEMKALIVAFIRTQIAQEENIQQHFQTLLQQMEKK